MLHTFKFEGPEGGFLESDSDFLAVQLRFSEHSKGHGMVLDSRYVREGGKLAPGFYSARYSATDYPPIEVREHSPKELVFRLPVPVTYCGRATDGVSREPFPGAFVFGMHGVSHNNLALLTDAEWDQLEALPPNPAVDNPALKPLQRLYGIDALVEILSEVVDGE